MNNTQLYLSIGIPTLTVILAWASTRSQLNKIMDKVDHLGAGLTLEISGTTRSLLAELRVLRNDLHNSNLTLMAKLEPRN